ncbi:hypothetical protein JAAARDRAFT_48933 [Jaapia argillacea MUCL 33604]|uniref:Uncharacterized protein n=1 Tax=Jaapia argillacea MUCL 33604 TaxID=933084 RepID=A0A067PJV7_9AGAM|nr:hypothetical protein JAAARDRAFT_48933 [Jaapia argillacea MUCL 33604]
MSITPSDVFSGIKFIQGVVSKVKDNRTNLQRLSGHLEGVIVTIEQTQSRDTISSDGYNDAMTVLSERVFSMLAVQNELKRSLGDRAWNRDEIEVEIKRIIEDVNHHLRTHSLVFVQDPSHGCHAEGTKVKEVGDDTSLVKVADEEGCWILSMLSGVDY